MANKHITMRGEVIDMERLKMSNGEQVALGNASKNARGDQLGPGGVVIRTQEQIEAEWEAIRARKEAQTKSVDLKKDDGLQRALDALAPKAKKVVSDDMGFEPEVPQQVEPTKETTRRRIVDNN